MKSLAHASPFVSITVAVYSGRTREDCKICDMVVEKARPLRYASGLGQRHCMLSYVTDHSLRRLWDDADRVAARKSCFRRLYHPPCKQVEGMLGRRHA